jgi:rubrerythrin
MKVINYLLKVESEGHKYYKELADKAPNRGFAYIFNMLARDEKKHYDAIEQLSFTGTFEMANTTIPGNTLTMFEKLRADPDVNLLAARDQVELYEQARNLEARNRDEYLQRARDATDPDVKKLFLHVALEEQKHYVLLNELLCFVRSDDEPMMNAETPRNTDAYVDDYRH